MHQKRKHSEKDDSWHVSVHLPESESSIRKRQDRHTANENSYPRKKETREKLKQELR